MDPAISKAAIEVTEKIAESLAPPVIQKVLNWISKGKTRTAKPRADLERRHDKFERRISGVEQRLRIGFWLAYHRKSGAGKLDIVATMTSQMREHLFQAMVKEARNYSFSDRSGSPLKPNAIAGPAIDLVWMQWKQRPLEERQAVLVVEGIADYLLAQYNVVAVDRREKQRRAAVAS